LLELRTGLGRYQPKLLISIVYKYKEEVLVVSQSLIEKTTAFRDLNSRGRRLLLPNAWDAASARVFEEAGFGAIGTTSAGIAYSLGLRDGQHIARRTMMEEIRNVVASGGGVPRRVRRAIKFDGQADVINLTLGN